MAHYNPNHDECWGSLKHKHGYCYKKHREGMLTCAFHASQEAAAQALKQEFDAADAAAAAGEPPPEWLSEIPWNKATSPRPGLALYNGYHYYWYTGKTAMPNQKNRRGAWKRGESQFSSMLDKVQEQVAAACNITAIQGQLDKLYAARVPQISASTFSDLRVVLVPVVAGYRLRRWQSDSVPERLPLLHVLDADGCVVDAPVTDTINDVILRQMVFERCDICGEPVLQEQITSRGDENLCPCCDIVHADASELPVD